MFPVIFRRLKLFAIVVIILIASCASLISAEPGSGGGKTKDKDHDKDKVLSYIFKSTAENVDSLLRPWPSNSFISIYTNELLIKVLVMLFPLICVIIAIQTYLTVFGPSNNYVGYTGDKRLLS